MSALARLRRWWHQGSIRQELLLTTSTALLLFFAGLVLFAHATNRLLAILHEGDRYEQTLAAAENLRRLMATLDMTLRAYADSGRPDFLRSYQIGQQAFQYDAERILTWLAEAPAEGEHFESALRYADRWHTHFAGQAIRLRRSGQDSRALLAAPEPHDTLQLFNEALGFFADQERRRLAELRVEAEALVRRMLYLGLVLSVLGIVGSLWWTSWLARSLTQPLEQLLKSMEDYEAGQAPAALVFTRPPEMVRLAERFHQMVSALARSHHDLEAFQAFTENLHRSQTAEEMRRAFLHAVEAQFQPQQGLVLAADTSTDTLQVADRLVATAPATPAVMTRPPNCPAVRTSKPYGIADTAREAPCACELEVSRAGSYFCLPLQGGGSLLGLACLTGPAGLWTSERRQPARRYAERLADELYGHQLFSRAQEQAMMDELTQLYNRRFAEEYLQKLVALSRRTQRSFSVLLLDLDHFKAFNDCFGHAAGDRLLRAFAAELQSILRRSAIAARWGGEEFLVILPEEDLAGARVLAERLRASTAQIRLDAPLTDLAITVSIGIGTFPVHGRSQSELLQAADRALYQAKREGRNRVEVPANVPSVA